MEGNSYSVGKQGLGQVSVKEMTNSQTPAGRQ